MNKSDVTARFEEEKLRVQEQSQLIYLQNQIDELRRMIKDQNNKYAWAMEQARRSEGQVNQMQNIIERHAQEIQTTLEVYKRELTALRRDVAAALTRAEESVKPLRDLQAHIHQLQEARRQERDAVLPWYARIEELEHRIREIVAHVREGDERYRHLQNQLEQVRAADVEVVEEIQRIDQQIEIEKQVLRRQAVEAQQLVSDVRASLDDPLARIARLEERTKAIVEFVETLPPQIDAVAIPIPVIQEEVRRVELVSTERFLMTQERLEDLRHQNETRLAELHDTDEDHLRHLTGWLERLEGWCREEEGRVVRIGNRLELLHQRHEGRLSDLETQEMYTLERITSAWQGVLEGIKQAQVERRDSFADQDSGRRG